MDPITDRPSRSGRPLSAAVLAALLVAIINLAAGHIEADGPVYLGFLSIVTMTAWSLMSSLPTVHRHKAQYPSFGSDHFFPTIILIWN